MSPPSLLKKAAATLVALSGLLLAADAFVAPTGGLLAQHRRHTCQELASVAEPVAAASTAAAAASARRTDIKNFAIVAHVDHGKTTLVDAMLRQSAVFRDNEKIEERVMDSNDQERERGITILAKNCAINYGGIKMNLIDTPGHADFGGEVERVLNMVDGVLLVVDSVEGPKPQTRFVLSKALALGLKPLVVVNKIDRPSARPEYVVDTTFDLFMDLDANDDQINFQTVYASAIQGIAGDEPDALQENIEPLFKAMMDMPSPIVKEDAPLQLLTANIDYDDFKGKLGIGRVHSGTIKKGQTVGVTKPGEPVRQAKISELFVFDNLGRAAVDEAKAGDIVMVAGISDVNIGDTIVDINDPQPMEPIAVEEPTVRMTFGVNKSPLAGKEGKFLTSRMIRDRLMKELDRNVALKVSETDSADVYEVSGRGQLHLTVLIETMRREGFELFIGPPTVITRTIDGKLHEPFEKLDIQVPDEYTGAVVDLLSRRKGEMINMMPSSSGDSMTQVEYVVPTRGMIGLRNLMLTATRGTVVMDTLFDSYKPWAGDIEQREKGSLIATEDGTSTTFGIMGAQDRGGLFISPKDDVFAGMIVGVNARPDDLKVNVCKVKAVNNIRSATKEKTEGITEPLPLNLDIAVELVQADELLEVTPSKVRLLKNPAMGKRGGAKK